MLRDIPPASSLPSSGAAAPSATTVSRQSDATDLTLPLSLVSALLTALEELATADDLPTGLDRITGLIAEVLPSKTIGVLLLDELGRELSFTAHRGIPAAVAAHWRFGLGQGIVGSVAHAAKAIRVDDTSSDLRYMQIEPTVRSELALPLLARGRAIGVLDLERTTAHGFSAADETLATFLANHLGPAIEEAQRHHAAREQTRTLALLQEVGRELGSILDRKALLSRVGERIKQLIDYEYFTVLLWNDTKAQLEPWLSLDRRGTVQRVFDNMPLGVGLCGTAAALRQPIRVANVYLDPRFVRCQHDHEVRSELVVPLTFEGRLLGVLDLESAEYDAFRAHHEHLLVTLASTLAIALENARLYECRRSEEERLTADLETARQIQLQLLPKSTPWVPGLRLAVAYEAARHLGGDFYDFLLDPTGGTVTVALGDVSGKSTGAALYGSFAIGLLRELHQHYVAALRGDTGGGPAPTHESVDPAELLADLNCSLHALGFNNRYLAMAMAVYDPARRHLRLVNAGLPHPWLIRHLPPGDGEQSEIVVEALPVGGVPLGMFANRRYTNYELDLAPGDILVFASDGVEEALDHDEIELGPARLAATLARLVRSTPPRSLGEANTRDRAAHTDTATTGARAIAEGLLAEVHRHAAGVEPSDDRTVVVLEAY